MANAWLGDLKWPIRRHEDWEKSCCFFSASLYCPNSIFKPRFGGLILLAVAENWARKSQNCVDTRSKRARPTDTIDVRCAFEQEMRHDRREFINLQSAVVRPRHLPGRDEKPRYCRRAPSEKRERAGSRWTVKSATASAGGTATTTRRRKHWTGEHGRHGPRQRWPHWIMSRDCPFRELSSACVRPLRPQP